MTTAMLLGAGYGKRLRPLTAFRPKPLAPVGLKPLLDWHLDSLKALGVSTVALNASHLAGQIDDHLRAREPQPPDVSLLREDVPLGTGGGLLNARGLLGEESLFLVINADLFHAIDLRGAVAAHLESGAEATLVVRRAGPGEPQDQVAFDREGRLTGIGGSAAGWRFTGIHVLQPAIFDHLPSRGSLADGYAGLLRDGAAVASYDCGDALWFDVGTPETYLAANIACARMSDAQRAVTTEHRTIRPLLVAESAEIEPGCAIGPNVTVGENAVLESGARISDSVIWPGTSVSGDAVLNRCVVHPGGIMSIPEIVGDPAPE